MMNEASRFWSNQEEGKLYAGDCYDLLTRENALSWLKKDRWTVWEGACLLSGLDPDCCRISFFDLEVAQIICNDISDITPNLMGGKTYQEAKGLADQLKVRFYQLLGHVAKYTGGDDFYSCASMLSFPVKAFFCFGLFVFFPNIKHGQNLPCFGIFHDIEAETKAASHNQLIDKFEKIDLDFKQALNSLGLFTEEEDLYSGYELELVQEAERNCLEMEETISKESFPPSNQSRKNVEDVAPWDLPLMRKDKIVQNEEQQKNLEIPKQIVNVSDDQIIIDGVTVADIRALADKSNPRYRNELHAALCVWASFEHEPVPEGVTVKDAVLRRLNDWAEDQDATFKKSEIDRIAVMVNWDKDGNKQRPKAK